MSEFGREAALLLFRFPIRVAAELKLKEAFLTFLLSNFFFVPTSLQGFFSFIQPAAPFFSVFSYCGASPLIPARVISCAHISSTA